jgi:hypothetical protein
MRQELFNGPCLLHRDLRQQEAFIETGLDDKTIPPHSNVGRILRRLFHLDDLRWRKDGDFDDDSGKLL